MLQNKFEMPLDLAIKPSGKFNSYLVTVFLLSVTSLLIPTSLSVAVTTVLFFLLFAMAGFIYKDLKHNQVNRLIVNNVGEWELEVDNKKYSDLELSGECIVTHFLIWLNLSANNKKVKNKIFRVLLLPDSSDKDLLRQLRVRLRFILNNKEKDELEKQ